MMPRTVDLIPDDSPLRNPAWTTPHSRHAESIAEALINHGVSHDCATDPVWAGESILAAVRGMWEAKAEIEAMRLTDAERQAVERAIATLDGWQQTGGYHSAIDDDAATLRGLLERTSASDGR